VSVDRERLALVLGMMGSAHDSKALNAARLAVRMAKEAELAWPEVLDGERVVTEAARILLAENEQLQLQNQSLQEELARLRRPQLPKVWVLPQTPGEQTAQAIEWTAILNDWERSFITDMSERWRPPTERQQAIVDRISGKIASVARARGLHP
jgi:hypothetical protein